MPAIADAAIDGKLFAPKKFELTAEPGRFAVHGNVVELPVLRRFGSCGAAKAPINSATNDEPVEPQPLAPVAPVTAETVEPFNFAAIAKQVEPPTIIPAIDPAAITTHVALLHTLAAGLQGSFVLADTSAQSGAVKFRSFAIGDAAGMTAAILAAKTGRNLSVPWVIMRPDWPGEQWRAEDVLAALAIITDRDHDKYHLNELALEPSGIIKTAWDNFQSCFIFSRPVLQATEPELFQLVADASGGGSAIPGTIHWPTTQEQGAHKPNVPQLVTICQPFGEARLNPDTQITLPSQEAAPTPGPAVEPSFVSLEALGTAEELTELGNARRLIRLFGANLRYVYAFKTWFVFDGTHWRQDDGAAIQQYAQATIETLFNEARSLPEEARRNVRKYALSCQNNRHLKAVAELARSFSKVILPHQGLDADPMLLGVENGTIDLRTNTFHEGRREDYITKHCHVAFDPQAKCPNWKKFQMKIADESFELVEYKQKVFGLMLCGEVPELLFIAHGGGNNGKTTEGETIFAILGDYAHASDSSLLITPQKATGSASPEILILKGKRGLFINETDAKDWLNEARVKYLTGRDMIYARGLHQAPVNFKPTHKPFVRTQHKPKVRGKDLAIWRRIQYIPYAVTIPDAEIKMQYRENFLVPEHAGILNWMLEGWAIYRDAGYKLKPPAKIIEGNKAYKTEMDKASQWVTGSCEKVIGEKLPLKVLHQAYVNWFTGEIGAVGFCNNQSLADTLRDHHFKDVKNHAGQTVFENIRLKTPARMKPRNLLLVRAHRGTLNESEAYVCAEALRGYCDFPISFSYARTERK